MAAKLRAGGVHRNTPGREPSVPPWGDSESFWRGTRGALRARYARSNVSAINRSSTVAWSARGLRLTVARDAMVATVAFTLTLAMVAHGSGGTRRLDALSVGLAVITCLPLLASRRRPLGVFVVCTVPNATLEGVGYALGPPFGPTVALFYLAADRRTPERMRQIAVAVVALGAIHVGVAAATTSGFPTIPILGAIVVWGGAWIVGTSCASAGSGSRTYVSAPSTPSAIRHASVGWPWPRSATGSRGTCTILPRTPST